MSDSKAPFGTLTARLEERILQPLRSNAFARRTWFTLTVVGILCLYGLLLAWLLWRDAADPPKGMEAQETPVEVVAEMPKPPAAPAPTPAPTPPAPKQDYEKPATSAPRAQNEAKEEPEKPDPETRAPKSAATIPPKPVAPPVQQAAREPAAAPDKTPDKVEDKPDAPAEAKPETADADAEALDRATPEPPRRPDDLPKPAPKPAPKVAQKKVLSAAEQLAAGTSSLPDYTFAAPMRKHAKVTGGTEDDRYLAVVYGLITQSRRPMAVPAGNWTVAVAFVVDGSGNLRDIQLTQSSGYREIDAAAVQSVRDAAPFPPPPSGGATGLVARLRGTPAAAPVYGAR